MKPLKEKKPFQAPHTFVILVVLILLAVAATYVVLFSRSFVQPQ